MDMPLRGLVSLPTTSRTKHANTTGLFWLSVGAIALQFIFSTNVLSNLGIQVGNIHPATFLLMIGAMYSLARGVVPFSTRLRSSPGLMLFLFGIPAVILYSIYFVGFAGATVYVETFWSAGLLALLLEPASAKQKRLLAGILMTLVIGNVLVSLYESLTHVELFPIAYDPTETAAAASQPALVDDFRAHAFYSHPLSASLVTSMACFLLYSMRMRFSFAVPTFGLLLLGLLAFGGRAALGVTALVSIGTAFYVLLAGVVKRNLRTDFVLSILSAAIIIPIVVAIVSTQTTIADRIMDNLYYDDSAAVRSTQWEIFNHLEMRDWLFGISKNSLSVLKYQIGLGGKDTDIENCWILILLDLGAIGFVAFIALLGGFIVHLARRANSLNGWLLVGSALLIDSSSNSLGVWSNDLMLEVAFLMAISGFRGYVPLPRLRRIRRSVAMPVRMTAGHSGLLLLPRSSRISNLRVGKLSV